MIKKLSIKNYKSIKDLELQAKRVNVFIGEHNSGKSNILEALSWFSLNSLSPEVFSEIFRFKNATDFFYDFDTTDPIEVVTDKLCLAIRYGVNRHGALLNKFQGLIYSPEDQINPKNNEDVWFGPGNIESQRLMFDLTFKGHLEVTGQLNNSPFRTYVFKRVKEFVQGMRPILDPPFGENIASLLISNKELKELVSALFREKGFRLMLKPSEGEINMAKDVNDELFAYPYSSISETLQRIVFYSLAIESNHDATLVLDEPESNTFPMYTKQLAEMMALDESNQYFIATHNPYLLQSLISKTPKDEMAVFVTRMEDFQTRITPVSTDQLSSIMEQGIDVYFNLDKLVEG